MPLINSLVVYVGTHAISQLRNKGSQITHSAPMDIFQHLVNHLEPEGRYFFLNAIANQLRYPNNHTHYFSCVLLYLFAEAKSELIQEQITRVLARAAHRAPAAPVGAAHHVHRAHQEPALRVLVARLHALRDRDRARLRERRALHGLGPAAAAARGAGGAPDDAAGNVTAAVTQGAPVL